MGTKKIRDTNGKVVKETTVLDKVYKKPKPAVVKVSPRKKTAGFYVWYANSFIYRLLKGVLDKRILFTSYSFNFYMYQWFNGKPDTDINNDDVVKTVIDCDSLLKGELLEFYYNKLKDPPTLKELSSGERWTNTTMREHFLANHTKEIIYGKNTLDPKLHTEKYDESEFIDENIEKEGFK